MEAQKVDLYLISNARKFLPEHVAYLRQRLLEQDDSKWYMLSSVDLQDPNTTMIVSVMAGKFGIDRFIIGDVGLGVFKLLTCGGLGIWWIIDWFLIQDATRRKNMEKIQMYL
jgi:hypothetical protein